MLQPIYRIFVSSNYADLIPHRHSLRQAILDLGHHPIMTEDLTAPEGTLPQLSYLKIQECDIFVGVYAYRYGYVPPSNPPHTYCDKRGMVHICDGSTSLTEYEYQWAQQRGIPCLLFQHDANVEWLGITETEPDMMARLADFRQLLGTHHSLIPFQSPADLAEQFTRALHTLLNPTPVPDVPECDPLPHGSRLPMPSGPCLGRDADLHALAHRFFSSNEVTRIVLHPTEEAAVQTDGVGLSRLALEFCWRHGSAFTGVHWLQVSSQPNAVHSLLRAEIAACGEVMASANAPPWPVTDLEAQVQWTLNQWRHDGPRLVVLDGLYDPSVLEAWLPHLSRVHLLITSPLTDWADWSGLITQPVKPLAPNTSLEILYHYAPRIQQAPAVELERIVQALGGWPLHLHLAGHFLQLRPRLSLGDYLDKLKKMYNTFPSSLHAALLHRTSPPRFLEQILASLLTIAWQFLENSPQPDLAALIMQALAGLAPNVPAQAEWLAWALHAHDADGTPTPAFDAALQSLVQIGLVQRLPDQHNRLVVHPVVSDFARYQDQSCPDESPLVALAEALTWVSKHATRADNPADFAPLRPHLVHLSEAISSTYPSEAARLWHIHGTYLAAVQDYLDAKVAFEDAARVLPEDHPTYGAAINSLGLVLQDIGDLAGAKAAFERAIAVGRAYRSDPTTLGGRVNNLGVVLHRLGDFTGAHSVFLEAQYLFSQKLAPTHPQMAILLSNLGKVLHDAGDLAGAKAAFEQALAIEEYNLGPDHPFVAFRLVDLGEVLQVVGPLSAARAAFERALAIQQVAYGLDDPHAAATLGHLGVVLRAVGDLVAARSAFERALTIEEQSLGPDHPTVAERYLQLAGVLHALGLLDGALDAYEHTMHLTAAIEGQQHPKVGVALRYIGEVLRGMGELPAAKVAFEQALAIAQHAHGNIHPEVATILEHLASLHKALNDPKAEWLVVQRLVEIDEQLYGPHHPNLARDLNRLGALHKEMGDLSAAWSAFYRAQAIEQPITPSDNDAPDSPPPALANHRNALLLAERALLIDQRVNGPDHPAVAHRLTTIANLYADLDDFPRAQTAYEQALAILERAHGLHNEAVARLVTQLGRVLYAQGNFKGAKTAYNRALAIDQRVYGPEHPEVARDYGYLGRVHQAMNQLDDAAHDFQHALTIAEHAYGVDHPSVAIRVHDLAQVVYLNGDLAGAIATLQRAHDTLRDFMSGEEHPYLVSIATTLQQWRAEMVETRQQREKHSRRVE